MIRLNQLDRINKNERGVVAIFSALILMIVISIIVIGFSQVSRREATDALNRQLSLEASYSAESGINDANSVISYYQSTNNIAAITSTGSSCKTAPYIQGSTYVLSATNQYTCLSVNPNPHTLTFPGVVGSANVADLTSNTGSFDTLNIAYYGTNPISYNMATCPRSFTSPAKFYPDNLLNWPSSCPPVIQFDLVPVPTVGLSEGYLKSKVLTFYLYPANVGPTTASAAAMIANKNGYVYAAGCNTAATCDFNITGLTAAYGVSEFYVKSAQFYNNANVQYNGTTNGCNCSPISFTNSQILIDSTGNANGVLKRAQVTLNVSSSFTPNNAVIPPPPLDALQSTSTICKRLVTGPGFTNEDIPVPKPTDITVGPPPFPVVISPTDACSPLY
jgi:Tfp pilus assembly protein PilX